jgi:deoxyribonuclease-4
MLFGTVGSPTSTPLKPGGSVGAIQHIHALGLSSLELGWVQSVRVTEQTCDLLKTTSKNENVALSVHAPYFINLNASEEEWPKSRKRLMDAAYYGYLAGATDIVFHPGSYFAQTPEEVLKKALPRLADCVKELSSRKINVILRPETMGKGALLGSFKDTLAMSKNIPTVLPCLDFAHLHARQGDGSLNSEAEWEELLDQYGKDLGSDSLQHLHIHLSGIEYTEKGEKNHLPLKESDLDVKGLFQALKKYKANGRILCESPILEQDALYLQELWVQ